MLVLDDAFVSTGSYNLDQRSLAYNLEMVVNIVDEGCAREAASFLEEDMAAGVEISLAAYAKRPWYVRLLERCAYALRRWL
jgi:phosphatidylserine/phosphatidylglycerophosphate/cardiolipin synthase-like enzyme